MAQYFHWLGVHISPLEKKEREGGREEESQGLWDFQELPVLLKELQGSASVDGRGQTQDWGEGGREGGYTAT